MRTPRLLAALTATALLGLTACGSNDTDASEAKQDSSFAPVTIKHVHGETTITAKPTRVATVAWANHEVPLALGVVPVGMSKATWGDDDNDGVLPWVEDKLEELDADTPVLFDETDGIDFEAVADTQPDVILASYSGLTKEEYDKLSQIAPTVAYPKTAWGTSLEDMIAMNSQALGLAEEGEALQDGISKTVAEEMAARPVLADKKILFTYLDPKDPSTIGFYTNHDTRPGFLLDAGMKSPGYVTEVSGKTEGFYETISAEQGDKIADADIFVTYGATDGSTLKQAQGDALLSKIPAVQNGAIAVLEDSTPLAASANPSPLSIDATFADYLDILAAAAEKSK